jgi:glycosyltransferase involved in cell wall biosynthesis
MRIALLAHGFPPEQTAGTETHTARLADGLRARGHRVTVVAAAPRPGALHASVSRDGDLVRIVQNAPYAALRAGGRDRAVEAVLARVLDAVRPELVHVQHLSTLSAHLPTSSPIVWMLHDAWAWCAAGGLLLRDGEPCAGPSESCAPCASTWVRDPPAVTWALRVAGRLGRHVDPATLHALWRRLPGGVRERVVRAPPGSVTAGHLDLRDAALRAFASRCAAIVAPSRWLAHAAAAAGFTRVEVLPHGVDPLPLPRDPDGPFLFLGTRAWHKGPDLVVEAHRRSGVGRPLRLHGPAGPDAAYAARFPGAGALDATQARRAVASARALVMGSRWPENAPLVVLEARAQGVPVIAPRLGGLPEIVRHGVDGWCVAPNDADALASALREADSGPLPPVSAPPTFASHLDAFETVYRRCVGGP